jgi:hypothetical protein
MKKRRHEKHASKSGFCNAGHEWVVYSTALAEGWLMLKCVECGAMGTINDPSAEDWSDAYQAPSRPYRWKDGTRITDRGIAFTRIIRAVHNSLCGCPCQRGLPEKRGYDRLTEGIWEHSDHLSDHQKAVLIEFAAFVAESELCSRFLPAFIQSLDADRVHRSNWVIYNLVDRIEQFDAVGLHCSPAVVARIFREYASWESL